MYGIKGDLGNLKLAPQLLKEQFEDGKATTSFLFADKIVKVTYVNEKNLDAGEYKVEKIEVNGDEYAKNDTVLRSDIEKMDKVEITAYLG